MSSGVEVDFVESLAFLYFSRQRGRAAEGIVECLLDQNRGDVRLATGILGLFRLVGKQVYFAKLKYMNIYFFAPE